MVYATASSLNTAHPLRRSSGLIFVIALHLAVIVAIQSGTSSTVSISPTIPTKIVPTFEKPAPPPVPTDTAEPIIPTARTFIPAVPSDPVVEKATPSGESLTTSPSETGGESTRIERAIVGARVDPSRPLTQPAYPPASRRNGEQGRVELMLYILANGKVGDAKIEQSSGYSRLDDSAMREALRSWRFIPQQENGIAVASWQRFAITFRLEN